VRYIPAERILGIDPGLALMGYGVVEVGADGPHALDYAVLTTPPGAPAGERLRSLYHGLISVIERYHPSEVAIELFVARNLRSALSVGQARGVAILAAAQKGLPTYDYTPSQVQRSVTYGRGRKEKWQIQEMVRLQLGLEQVPRPDDAADALAVALCHIRQVEATRLLSQTG